MKTTVLALLLLGCACANAAQWEKIAAIDVGATGQMTVHGSTVFFYGYQGKQFVYRSTDHGATWTNIADKFSQSVYCMHGHGAFVFAIVGVNGIYESSDDGVTWNKRSTVPLATGAVLSLVSDGATLYAVSNRNAVAKSTDNGLTWTIMSITYGQTQITGFDFAAVGSKMVFTSNNLGAFISMDGGITWSLKNPSNAIGTVHAHNGEIFGSTYGMFRLNGTPDWTSIVSGFASGIGVTASTRSTVSFGNRLYTYYADVITGAKIYTSDNNGTSWSEVGTNFPNGNATSLNNFMAVSSEYVYCYVYSAFAPTSIGVYRHPNQAATALERVRARLPEEISMDQNYPNPFNPTTEISFHMPRAGHVTLTVYDAIGRAAATLVDGDVPAGNHTVSFSTEQVRLSSGVYFCTMRAGTFTRTLKMIVAK